MGYDAERIRLLSATECAWCRAWVPQGLVVRAFTFRTPGHLPKRGAICAPCDWTIRASTGRATVTARDAAEYRTATETD